MLEIKERYIIDKNGKKEAVIISMKEFEELIKMTKQHQGAKRGLAIRGTVNSTWRSIKLDRKTAKFVAEDKELEYETQ